MRKSVKIGTRGSRLALWQANFVADQLRELGVEVALQIIKTKGDQIQDIGFQKMEGKGFFTKELEDALLRGEVDLAVHSMKDMPTTQPEGLTLAGVSYREDPADLLLINTHAVDKQAIFTLKQDALVGTSSARRKAQMGHLRPDVSLKDVRGNVPTRIQKLRDGQFDAILLASAGIKRLELDLSDIEVVRLHPREFVPAPAQGVMAFQVCTHDVEMRRLIKKIHQSDVSRGTNIERKILKLLDGGCQLPLGAYCEVDQLGNYHVWAAGAKNLGDPVKHFHTSSATSHNLAEEVLNGLELTV